MSTIAAPFASVSESAEVFELSHWVNGARVAGASGRFGDVFHPASGRVQARVPLATDAEVDAAVQAAARAFPAWAGQPPLRRARVLFRFREIFEQRLDEVAACLTREHGKVNSDARGEATRGLEVVEFATGIPSLLKGEFTEQVGAGIDSWSMRQPLGVVAGITPFNFPAMVPMWMFPVAIACGNTFVLKPSERDPSASMLLAEMLKEAGLPDGVFNVVHGDKEALSTRSCDHQRGPGRSASSARRPSPSTSTREGTSDGQAGAGAGRREEPHDRYAGRGPGPSGRAGGCGVRLGGERCMAISVAVAVGAQTADTLKGKLVERIAKLRIGDGSLDTASSPVDLGPLVTKVHLDKVSGLSGDGRE